MTVMGMAASQARFLGLTARKSNVEYQGQQINQQRTALSNESANLYNQMMDLSVPTPPSTTDYYKTTYTLEDSAVGNNSAYQIKNLTKISGDNRYTVTLEYSTTETTGSSSAPYVTSVIRSKVNDSEDYNSYVINIGGSNVTYTESDCTPYATDDDGNTSLKTTANKIYKIDDTAKSKNLSGYSECLEKLKADGSADDNTQLYFYVDNSGKYCYMTQDQLDNITTSLFAESSDSDTRVTPEKFHGAITYPTQKTTPYTTTVNATVESNSTGRYTSIVIDSADEDAGYPADLNGKTFGITTSTVQDEDAYDDAFNDYEYQKSVYDQRVAEINAQTESIQSQDQQLELRLDQLDTEQNAIKTEIESVQKVIDDNVEQTFKIFA